MIITVNKGHRKLYIRHEIKKFISMWSYSFSLSPYLPFSFNLLVNI